MKHSHITAFYDYDDDAERQRADHMRDDPEAAAIPDYLPLTVEEEEAIQEKREADQAMLDRFLEQMCKTFS